MKTSTPTLKSSLVAPPTGITAALHVKSRRRREEQRTLVETGARSPTRRNDLLPELAVVRLPIDSLMPANRRVRRSSAGQIAKVSQSIEKFGFCQPILVDHERRIVHGHTVWEAAKRLGLSDIPVIEIGHLSPSALRLLAITLNRLGEQGSWDEEALRLEFQELLVLEEDVFVTGFDAPEIDMLVQDDAEQTADDTETLPAPPRRPVSRPKDLWRLGNHLLLQADSRDATSYGRLFEDGARARLVLTDEPFNVRIDGHVTKGPHREFAMASGELTREQFAEFNQAWMRECAAVLIDGGLLATFIDWRSIDLVLEAGRVLGLELLNLVVWSKSNAGQGALWRSQHELLPIFKLGSAPHINNVALGKFGRWRSNVWVYAGASSLGSDAREGLALHPTVKPRAMLADAILDVTDRGDIVLEPFCGSGSTILAAEDTGRFCRAIEIDAGCCDVSIQRWQAHTGEDAVLVETGESFAVTAERRLPSANGEENDR